MQIRWSWMIIFIETGTVSHCNINMVNEPNGNSTSAYGLQHIHKHGPNVDDSALTLKLTMRWKCKLGSNIGYLAVVAINKCVNRCFLTRNRFVILAWWSCKATRPNRIRRHACTTHNSLFWHKHSHTQCYLVRTHAHMNCVVVSGVLLALAFIQWHLTVAAGKLNKQANRGAHNVSVGLQCVGSNICKRQYM